MLQKNFLYRTHFCGVTGLTYFNDFASTLDQTQTFTGVRRFWNAVNVLLFCLKAY